MKHSTTFKDIVRPSITGLTLIAIAIAAFFLWMPQHTDAAAPTANTQIGNQASATYTDAGGTQRTATSNVALTTIQQVGNLLLQADRTATAAPGGQVAFPHTLQNTGNGSDTYSLSVTNLTGDNFDLTGLAIYLDANQDGIPDNLTPITSTGPLAAGGSFNFVIVGSVPGSETAGLSAKISVTAISTFDVSKTATNTDTAQVSNQAVLTLTKAMSATSGSRGSTNTVTLTYINTGNNTATNAVITDPLPTGFLYVGGSGRWSVSGTTPLTDVSDTGVDPAGINYSTNVVAGVTNVQATVTSIAPGLTAYITFQVSVATNAPSGIIQNVATIRYDDPGTPVGPNNSNPVDFRVNGTAGVVLDDNPVSPPFDKVVTVSNAVQGATITFTNVVHNTGNSSDTFDITYSSGSPAFPSGTAIQLYQADGNTPMTDSNGNGTPDTGPVAAGATYYVVLKATLPPGAIGGPFNIIKTARSTLDSTISDTVTDRLVSVTASTVDLYQPTGGIGDGPEAAAIVTNTVNPGVSTTFTLIVSNSSAAADSYDLAYSTNFTFSAGTLPPGWTVQFRNGSTPILNTGSVPAGGTFTYTAVVTSTSTNAPGPQDLFFRVLSPTTSATDITRDRVVINQVRNIAVTPPHSGQVTPGGTVVYTQTVCNNGNIVETVALSTVDSTNGWASIIYLDANNNGTFDGTDPATNSVTVAIGACQTVFVKVSAPIGAPLGSTDVTTLIGNAGGGITSVVFPTLLYIWQFLS